MNMIEILAKLYDGGWTKEEILRAAQIQMQQAPVPVQVPVQAPVQVPAQVQVPVQAQVPAQVPVHQNQDTASIMPPLFLGSNTGTQPPAPSVDDFLASIINPNE